MRSRFARPLRPCSSIETSLPPILGHIVDSCTGETIEQALISLGCEELAGMIDKQATTDVRCEFCNRRYPFSQEELACLMEGRG